MWSSVKSGNNYKGAGGYAKLKKRVAMLMLEGLIEGGMGRDESPQQAAARGGSVQQGILVSDDTDVTPSRVKRARTVRVDIIETQGGRPTDA